MEGHGVRSDNPTSAMPKTEHYQWYTEQFAPTELHAHAIEETYYAGRTAFQSVAVLRTAVFGKMLVLDGDTQSSQADEKIYHETLVHPAMASVSDRSEVLILGGGEGATLREVLRDPSVRRCTMVDIDGEVVELSKKYLPEFSDGAYDDPRARVVIGDALKFIKEDGDRYGVVVSDLTEPLSDSPSFPLFNGEVFRDIKARLAPGGVYVLQASTAGFHNMALHTKMARSLRAHFRYVRSYYTHVPAFDNDWAFIGCSDDADVAATDPARIDTYVGGLRGESWFYDAETHRRLFALPLYLRRELAKDGDVFA
jgi:spermidine synthase